jgi:hypothetical protein
MKTFQFNAMGSDRTYWDFFTGYSLMVFVTAVLLAVVLWQLGSLAKSHVLEIRCLVWTLLGGTSRDHHHRLHQFLCCSRDLPYPGLRVDGHGGLLQEKLEIGRSRRTWIGREDCCPGG